MEKIEKQKENVSTLLTLIKENPDLEIMPMVDYEVVGDDYGIWVGTWGKAKIDEYYNADERIYLKSHDFDELVDEMLDGLTDEECTGLNDEMMALLAEQKVNNLPWEKAIVVNIIAY